MVLILLAAYANHFQNDFHFDDFHTIQRNPYITDLHYIPQFFTDGKLFSTLPKNATWRPLVSTSLAIDYSFAGLKPFFFHLSTFLWHALLVILLFFLFRRLMDAAGPHPTNTWTALFVALCFGLHPANAETANYIIQRGDIYSTLGVVASLLWFIARPDQRKRCWYLLPAAAACLSKAPALVFPLMLVAYVFLFEQDGDPKRWRETLRASAPALLAGIALAILTAVMTPSTYYSGAENPGMYRLTQPLIALHYFKSFFLPTELSADTDWTYVTSAFSLPAIAGYVFVIGLVGVAVRTVGQALRPIAFGIVWFIVALLPTSLLPLAEVTNDHRMYFPFVGLTLAIVWTLRLLLVARPTLYRAAAAAMVCVLAAEAVGTHNRNDVWHTEQSLWRDVTIKSPENGRGWMNYGITFVQQKDLRSALENLEHARKLLPDYAYVAMNLGFVYSQMGNDAQAEYYLARAVKLAPQLAPARVQYANWLVLHSRNAEALKELETAMQLSPGSLEGREVLMDLYAEQRNWPALDRLAAETLRLQPSNEVAKHYLDGRATRDNLSPEALVSLSARHCNSGQYQMCLEEAQRAASMRADYAEAYSNMAAAYLSMQRWDEGIQAAQTALKLKPGYAAAQANLDWALAHRPGGPSGRK